MDARTGACSAVLLVLLVVQSVAAQQPGKPAACQLFDEVTESVTPIDVQPLTVEVQAPTSTVTFMVYPCAQTHLRFDEGLALLSSRLKELGGLLPEARLKTLSRIPLWLETWPDYDPRDVPKAAEYHAGEWPITAGRRNPKKVKAVEFYIDELLDTKDSQPMVVLHELAHGYDHQMPLRDSDRKSLEEAYDAAKKMDFYTTEDAYALTDVEEYFAELTEAYFGVNDLPPKNLAELQANDSAGLAALTSIWCGLEYVPTDGMDFAEAEADAEGRGGRLAVIPSAEAQRCLGAAFPADAQNVWLGGVQAEGAEEPGGGWSWITGQPISYNGWCKGEPDNPWSNSQENRTRVSKHVNGSCWGDSAHTESSEAYLMKPMGAYLTTGEYLTTNDYLLAENKSCFAVMEPEGNFVVYRGSGPKDKQGYVWGHQRPSSGKQHFAIMQSDGNFVVYRGSGPSDNRGHVWSHRQTAGGGEFYVIMQDDCNLAVYKGTPGQKPFVWSALR